MAIVLMEEDCGWLLHSSVYTTWSLVSTRQWRHYQPHFEEKRFLFLLFYLIRIFLVFCSLNSMHGDKLVHNSCNEKQHCLLKVTINSIYLSIYILYSVCQNLFLEYNVKCICLKIFHILTMRIHGSFS